MPALSEDDLRRLERERSEADRHYNEALTLLDAALHGEPALPAPPSPIDESFITPINERWPGPTRRPATGRPSRWGGR